MKVKVFSREKWNDTKIDLVQNCKYRYKATGLWIDWFIPCSADGFPKILNSLANNIFQRFRKRRESAKWFQLVGVIKGSQKVEHEIELGKEGTFTALESGRLWVFANDVDFALWNNFGYVELEIEEVK